MGLADKVKSILQRAFPSPDEVRLDEHDGMTVFVISDRFKGMDFLDRQDLVWNILEPELNARERREITIVIAVTPKEEAANEATDIRL